MKLRSKLFLSYALVILLGLVGLAVAAAVIGPQAFSGNVQAMREQGFFDEISTLLPGDFTTPAPHTPGGGFGGGGQGGGDGGGDGAGMGFGGEGMMGGGLRQRLEDELVVNFREAMNRALLLAGLGTLGAAGLVSWWLSRRIVTPIRDISRASGHIAEGHYDERLPVTSEDELGELTASFNQMASALAETELRRRELIADVSHELKTPLATIKGYMEGLEDGIIPAAPETYQRIHREADRLQRLVYDLQELSRAEATELQLEIGRQDAVALAESALAWIRPQFDDAGITLNAELPAAAIPVQADFDRARQVLLNLLGNALQYTPAGGAVTLSLARVGAAARFCVADTGVGLSSADLKRVFDRFYRVDKSRARASGGSGIGLTIARHIVEAHGGRIWAESAGAGQGSTFCFTLPAQKA